MSLPLNQHQRVTQIDVLRAVAILLVLGAHAPVSPENAGFLAPVARLLAVFGWTGVDLFFVLSGFLVGGLLFRELQTTGALDVKRFWIRRAFKILPLYFVYLAFVGGLKLFLDREITLSAVVQMLLPNLLQVQNYFGTPRQHTWSLAVEEHFYLLLPLALLGLCGRQRSLERLSWMPWVACGVGVACLAGRALTASMATPFQFSVHVFATHLRMDSLFCGVALAYLYHFKKDVLGRLGRHPWLLLAVAVICVCPMTLLPLTGSGFVVTVGFTLLYLGYGALLLAFLFADPATSRFGRVFNWWPSRALGEIGFVSYAIYLWHIDIAKWPAERLAQLDWVRTLPAEMHWLIVTFAFLVLSCLAGAMMTACIERPFLALRDRWYPSGRNRPLPAADTASIGRVSEMAPSSARQRAVIETSSSTSVCP